MKRLHAMALLGLIAAGGPMTVFAADAPNALRAPRVLPVLVAVNASGKVTQVSPSSQLSPRLDRLLRENLEEMIVSPATDHGRPVRSQFVINLALEVNAFQRGYNAKFNYVSTKRIPQGSWYWVVDKTSGRLALAEQHVSPRSNWIYRQGQQRVHPYPTPSSGRYGSPAGSGTHMPSQGVTQGVASSAHFSSGAAILRR